MTNCYLIGSAQYLHLRSLGLIIEPSFRCLDLGGGYYGKGHVDGIHLYRHLLLLIACGLVVPIRSLMCCFGRKKACDLWMCFQPRSNHCWLHYWLPSSDRLSLLLALISAAATLLHYACFPPHSSCSSWWGHWFLMPWSAIPGSSQH